MNLDSEFKNRNKKQSKMKLNPVESKAEIAEIARHVKNQSNQIETLKVELFMLKRKDTSSLTMPTLVMPSPPQLSKKPSNILKPPQRSLSATGPGKYTQPVLPPIGMSNGPNQFYNTTQN